ncbi:hypothetical protein [Xenorhabdus doucetiae]|uniref:Uncharacterized protein n=1 Tax=Xenorhabdus doucetiae TaxID=351671 RepID=A0A068QV07_9GAMM|nr:hypothetical protein [Xenorhabdus doucetiae]CDG17690.1 exported protein of unknown function [Xenorhabdus doucetiae]
MNKKLAACMFSLILGAVVTTNASAYTAGFFPGKYGEALKGLCNLIPDGGLVLKLTKDLCL